MRFPKLAVFALLGCNATTPSDFAGTYNATIVDGANNCQFANWTQGNSDGNITVNITQDNTDAQLDVQGLVGLLLLGYTGSQNFSGLVSGDLFTASYMGTKTGTMASCSYTMNLAFSVTIDSNNNLSGTITYMCSNQQTVTAARTGP